MNFVYKKISNNDFCHIDQLIHDTYNIDSNISKKLNTFYSSHQNLGYVAYNDNELCCVYLSFPIQIIFNNRIYNYAQSGDSLTSNKYLGHNLIYNCAKLNYDYLMTLNFDGVFGFPSKNILRTRKKLLNWKEAYNTLTYTIIIPTLPISLLSKKFIFIKKLHYKWILLITNFFYKKGDYFESSNKSDFNYYINRPIEFWNYKLSKNNIFAIKINNVDVIFKFDEILYIGDINLIKIRNITIFKFNLFLYSLLTFNFIIKLYASPNTKLGCFFKSFSLTKKSIPFCYKNFTTNLELEKIKFTYFDYDTF